VHTLRRDLPYLKQNSVVGICSQWNRNDANNGLGFYVAMKLLWDAKLDVDALLADFYEKAYAEAAGPMRRYHERLETAMEKSGLHVAEQLAYRAMYSLFTREMEAALRADLEAARQAVRDPDAAKRVDLMGRGFQYARLVAAYLRVFAERLEKGGVAAWFGEKATDMAELEAACQPHLDALRKFIAAKENANACTGMGSYVERLLTPRIVAERWESRGDRPQAGVRLSKVQWLQAHPQPLSPTPPKTLALWIYGHDIDWNAETGPEHDVLALGKDGREMLLGQMGRKDRDGNRKNLAFIIRGVETAKLETDPLQVTVENPPGGPYGTAIFALYLMPDDATSEDDATRLIQQDLETVRRRAAAFVEFDFKGEASNDGQPAKAKLEIRGYP